LPGGGGLEGIGVVNFAVLVRVLRTTIKKGHQVFEEKGHPSEKRGYAYVQHTVVAHSSNLEL